MKHIVYIAPDSEMFKHFNAIRREAETQDQAELLRTLARDEKVTIFRETKDFVEAFNANSISPEGWLIHLDDGLSGKDYILVMLKRIVRDLQLYNAVPNDKETIEIPVQRTDILPLFPAYAVVRGAGEGDWCEEKIQRLTLRRNNILSLTLESGATLDASNLFIEDLRNLHDKLEPINPRDNAIIQALSEQKEGTYYQQ